MKLLMLALLGLLLTGCASVKNLLSFNEISAAEKQQQLRQNSLHAHLRELASQLFLSANRLALNETIAVGSFLPIEDLQGKSLPPRSMLGQQIQESMITYAAQEGLNVIEFKTAQNLQVGEQLDIMLSRDLDKLSKKITIHYFLTGTFTIADNGLTINARLIDLTNNSLVAAATDVLPGSMAISLNGQYSASLPSNPSRIYHLK